MRVKLSSEISVHNVFKWWKKKQPEPWFMKYSSIKRTQYISDENNSKNLLPEEQTKIMTKWSSLNKKEMIKSGNLAHQEIRTNNGRGKNTYIDNTFFFSYWVFQITLDG